MDFSKTLIFCPKCYENVDHSLSFTEVDLGHSLHCKGCDHSFNIHEVYDFLLKNFPGLENIIQKTVDLIYGEIRVDDGLEAERKKITKFIEENLDEKFLRKIIKNCVVHGNCFIKHNQKEDKFNLEILDLWDYKITTSHKEGDNGIYYGEQVESLINLQTENEIKRKDFSVFSTENVGSIILDVGKSELGSCVGQWGWVYSLHQYIIRNPNDPNIERLKTGYKNELGILFSFYTLKQMSGATFEKEHLASCISNVTSRLCITRERPSITNLVQGTATDFPKVTVSD